MQHDDGTLARVAASAVLAALPLVWLLRHRGARRDRAGEGKLDGLLLLGALVLAVFALFMAGTSLVRRPREARIAAEWQAVEATVGSCTVTERRTSGRTGGRSQELSCTVRLAAADGAVERTLTAGYPSRRSTYDRWIAAHPAGSTITLLRDPRAPATVVGLDLIAPSTTTARAAADQALRFAAVAAALFALSRLVVARRRRS